MPHVGGERVYVGTVPAAVDHPFGASGEAAATVLLVRGDVQLQVDADDGISVTVFFAPAGAVQLADYICDALGPKP